MMRVADYLANYIAKLGVKNVFMLSGTGSVHLDDAFAFQKDINHICARHEAAQYVWPKLLLNYLEKLE